MSLCLPWHVQARTRSRFRIPCVLPLIIGAATVMLAACGGGGGAAEPASVQIRTLSNRADLISDGDALVELVWPAGKSRSGLRADLDGVDVTAAFAERPDGRITGLVRGLRVGDNVLTVGGDQVATASLTLTNADRGGPVLSGAQATPFFCATPAPQGATATRPATNASGLGAPASDAQCNIATEFKLWYRSTATGCSLALPDPSPVVDYTAATPPTTAPPPANPCFRPYVAGAAAPADLATTTTDAGRTVPYIVRVERGTVNRGIYDIAVLFDPTKPWTAVAPQPQWNGKVVYNFGANTGQIRRQARPGVAWTNDLALSRGTMVVANSMSDSLQNSNRVMVAETVMMMKEHVIDAYGPIRYMIGNGRSGGSINSNTVASIQPGLLDGVTLSSNYPDFETVQMEVYDCTALVEAYQKPAWLSLMGGLTPAQVNAKKAAVNGHRDQAGCHSWFNAFGANAKAGNFLPRTVSDAGVIAQSTASQNNCQLPAGQVYDPVGNPGGPRCNPESWAESVWGRAPGAQARTTRDNTGVQYGLKALQAGAITGEEFVTLNEIVGGVDRDGNLGPARSVADPEALALAYRAGLVLSGAQLAKTAVIDMRGYDDSSIALPPGFDGIPLDSVQGGLLLGIHHQWRSFAIRDRLDRDAGSRGNQAIWRFGRGGLLPTAKLTAEAYAAMDEWLTALKADSGTADLAAKVRSSRPAAAINYCLLSTDLLQLTKVVDQAICDADAYLAPRSSPRQVAGGPRSEDILKCQLKPIDTADYGGRLTAAQLTRLAAVFPGGVCDWGKPGVGQQAAVSPLTFKAGPGGAPLPAAPVSVAR